MKVGRLLDGFLLCHDAADGGGAGGGTGDGGSGSDLISRAEAQKAFKDRDAAKQRARELEAKMKDLESRVMADEDRELFASLKEQHAKAEEERAKKAGEFESLKKQQQERHEQLLKEHQKQLADRDTRYSSLDEKFKTAVIKAEFGAATDFFGGGESSKTILDVDLGMAYLKRYVHVEDVEDDPLGYRVVVRNPRGEVIFGTDGNPAPFADAIGELIKQLPNKDRILRGSGKTGSGSSGGSTGSSQPVDLRNLNPNNLTPDQRAALLAMRGAGGVVMGSAFTKRG